MANVESLWAWMTEARGVATRASPWRRLGAVRFLGYMVDREERRVSGPTARRMRGRMRAETRAGLEEDLDELAQRWTACTKALLL